MRRGIVPGQKSGQGGLLIGIGHRAGRDRHGRFSCRGWRSGRRRNWAAAAGTGQTDALSLRITGRSGLRRATTWKPCRVKADATPGNRLRGVSWHRGVDAVGLEGRGADCGRHGESHLSHATACGSGEAPPARWGGLRLRPDRRIAPSGTLRRFTRSGHLLPKLSNSPFRTPPTNASHSPGVNRRTGPSASLLWRTPIRPSGRSATSTQLLLERE